MPQLRTDRERNQGLCRSRTGLGRRCCDSISACRGFLTLTDGAGGFLPDVPERLSNGAARACGTITFKAPAPRFLELTKIPIVKPRPHRGDNCGSMGPEQRKALSEQPHTWLANAGSFGGVPGPVLIRRWGDVATVSAWSNLRAPANRRPRSEREQPRSSSRGSPWSQAVQLRVRCG